MAMRCISLWQPWANLWCSPRKLHETRGWPTKHRGWLAVHAAKRRIDQNADPDLREILEKEYGRDWAAHLPTGAIIGAVNIIACRRTEDVYPDWPDKAHGDDAACGNFAPGRFAWQRNEYRNLACPIPYRGMQGLFTLNEAETAAIQELTGERPPADRLL